MDNRKILLINSMKLENSEEVSRAVDLKLKGWKIRNISFFLNLLINFFINFLSYITIFIIVLLLLSILFKVIDFLFKCLLKIDLIKF